MHLRIAICVALLACPHLQLEAQPPPVELPPASEQVSDRAVARLPWNPPTDEQQRRSRSLTHFGAGRKLARQRHYAAAIRQFQLAWLWDPSSAEILDQLIPLCFRTDQAKLGYRYARICINNRWDTIAPLRGIGFHAILNDSSEAAWQVYEQAVARATQSHDTNQLIGLHYDWVRMAYIAEASSVALPSAHFLLQAMPRPEAYEVDETTFDDVWGQPSISYSLIGEILLENDKFDEAETAFRLAADSNDNDDAGALLHFQLARIRRAAQDTAAARGELDQYFAADSQAAGTAAYELLEQLTDEPPTKFARRLEKLVAEQSANQPLLYYLGDFYLRHDRPAAAVPIFELLTESAEDRLAEQQLIASYAAAARCGSLLAAAGRIVQRYGNVDLITHELEQATGNLALVEKIVAEAQARLQNTQRKMLSSECLAAAFFCLRAKKYAAAEPFVKAAIERGGELEPLVESLYAWGLECLQADQLPLAIRAFESAILVDPEGTAVDDLNYHLAVAWQLDEQFERALTTIDAIATNQQSSLVVGMGRAHILYAAGRLEEAETEFASVIGQFNENETDDELRLDLFDAKLTAATICTELGKFAAAEAWLIDALCEFPLHAGAKNDLGYLWADQSKHLQLARQMIEAAVTKEPENVAFIDSLGWVLFRLGQSQQALGPLEKAAASDNPDGVILDHLGDVYDDLGRHAEAVATWQKALVALEQAQQPAKIEAVKRKIVIANQRQEN